MWMNIPPDPQTDLGPLPEVRESSTETSWALFQELQDKSAQGRPRNDLPFSVLPEPSDAAPFMGVTVEQVMLVASRRNRVCPCRPAWDRFHDVLQAAARQAAPLPMTQPELAASSPLGKRVRVRHQVEWAARNGVLHIAHAFLAGLAEEEWLHAG